MSTINHYENSLSGINPDSRKNILNSRDPFSMINIDKFNKVDLENIVSNIDVERTYQFTYKKKQNRK